MTDCTVQPGAVYRDTVDLRLLRIISVGLPAKWEEMALAELKQNTEARTEERDGETVVEEETNKQPLRQNILLSLTPHTLCWVFSIQKYFAPVLRTCKERSLCGAWAAWPPASASAPNSVSQQNPPKTIADPEKPSWEQIF